MKIKQIKIDKFKRFTDLTIKNIPESAKLIVLVGPNGSGKTSIFEAINHWYKIEGFNQVYHQLYSADKREYFEKIEGEPLPDNWFKNRVEIQFYNEEENLKDVKGRFYFRTAYRNEP